MCLGMFSNDRAAGALLMVRSMIKPRITATTIAMTAPTVGCF